MIESEMNQNGGLRAMICRRVAAKDIRKKGLLRASLEA